MLYLRVICQFHYKPHLQLSCFKSNQTVSWRMQAVSWDVGLALLRGPILHPLLFAEASAEQLTLLTVFFFFHVFELKHLTSRYFSFASSR